MQLVLFGSVYKVSILLPVQYAGIQPVHLRIIVTGAVLAWVLWVPWHPYFLRKCQLAPLLYGMNLMDYKNI